MTSAISKSDKKGLDCQDNGGADLRRRRIHDRIALRHSQSRELPRQSWIAVLKQDRREIFHAAAEAQRMADYILGFHPDYAETPSESSDAEDEGATSIAPPLAA